MKIEIRKSFERDATKLPNEIVQNLFHLIETINSANTLSEIPNLKKLAGFKYAYRIRLGQFRIGFFYDNGTIELVRILDRKDIYKFFP